MTIKGWNGVATWKWVANDDTCGICRVAFDGCCPDCKLPGDDCPLVWGQGRKRPLMKLKTRGRSITFKFTSIEGLIKQSIQNPWEIIISFFSTPLDSFIMTPSVHPLLPHPLHHEVAQLAAGPAPLPHVQAGVEVQRVKTPLLEEISFNRRRVQVLLP